MKAPAPITIEVVVAASPIEAWRAFTSPGDITQWNFASPDWRCPSAQVDLRTGGRYVARMEARDGSFGFDFSGVYEEVEAPKALTLRLDDNRRARTTFEVAGNGTRVRTVFDPEATNPADMQREGWQSILNNFKAHVESTDTRRPSEQPAIRSSKMTYVDGFVCAVPSANKEAYRKHAAAAAVVFREHGALSCVECWGDDVPEGKINSMHTAVMRKPDETVVFAWITWPDKATRDAGLPKVFADPRLQPDVAPMPYDGSRMIFGGFETILEA